MSPVAYRKDQWISSFEDAILRLRPHLTARILNTITGMAWQRHGAKGKDPKEAAEEYRQLTLLKPEDPDYLSGLIHAYQMAGRYPEASRMASIFVTRFPSHKDTCQNGCTDNPRQQTAQTRTAVVGCCGRR